MLINVKITYETKRRMPLSRRQYLLVDNKKLRRNSAPEYLGSRRSPFGSRYFQTERFSFQRASTSDLSVLHDNQSESGSSLELDTSNLSAELSPAPTVKDNISCSSSSNSYQSLPIIHIELYRRSERQDSLWNTLCYSYIWKVFFTSQIMSLCLTVLNMCNKRMRTENNIAGFANYVFLCLIWTTRLAAANSSRGIIQVFKFSGLRYLLLSLLHVEANYLLFASVRENSYMGNQVIDLVGATLSLVLTFVCLDVQFQKTHVTGFVITFLGAVGFCIANASSKNGEEEISWGDIFRIGIGIFLALNNLAQELIVKSIDSVEYLGTIGLFGSFISGMQTIILEKNNVRDDWAFEISFSIVQFILSCLTPMVLRDVGTTALHLALISSEFYSYFAYWLIQGVEFQFFYFFSYWLVLFGSYLFIIKRTTIGTHYFFPVKIVMPKGY